MIHHESAKKKSVVPFKPLANVLENGLLESGSHVGAIVRQAHCSIANHLHGLGFDAGEGHITAVLRQARHRGESQGLYGRAKPRWPRLPEIVVLSTYSRIPLRGKGSSKAALFP